MTTEPEMRDFLDRTEYTRLMDENDTSLAYLLGNRVLGQSVRSTLEEPRFEGSDREDVEELLTAAIEMIYDRIIKPDLHRA
jgi:hypothetical protein